MARKRHSRRHRGGAGAPNPSSYLDFQILRFTDVTVSLTIITEEYFKQCCF